MPNPNFSEFVLHADYGEDTNSLQEIEIYNAVAEDAYEIEHKYIEGADSGGLWVDLTMFFNYVRQIVIQNTSTNGQVGVLWWVDDTTGDLIPTMLQAGEHISLNNPDVTIGIMLFAYEVDEVTKWHLATAGGIP